MNALRKHQTESDRARAWLETIDLDNLKAGEHVTAEFFRYDVTVYRSSSFTSCFYLVTKSPQQKRWRRSALGTAYGKGDRTALIAGLDRFIREREAKQNQREAQKAARQEFQNPYKVGDFLYSSWGYDQTNREFYQVLEVRPLALKVREVCQNRTRNGYGYGSCSPIQNSFINDEPERWITVQVDGKGYHSVPSPIHGCLYKYEGKPVYYSEYA